MTTISAGVLAPDFTLPRMDDRPFSLAGALQRGSVVLAFFKISCPVCQYALPFLERIHRAYVDQRISLLGISQNPKKETAAFLQHYDITFPVVRDDPRGYQVSNAYGLTTVPSVFLVDPGGTVEVSSVGWSRGDVAEINRRLAQRLRAEPAPVFLPGEEVAEWRPG